MGTNQGAQQTAQYTFSYDNPNWKDQLTAVNGQPLTYDAIGNLIHDGTWQYHWKRGRNLTGMQGLSGSLRANDSIAYGYNHSNLRIWKLVNGVLTECIRRGRHLVHMTRDTLQMHFYYDVHGRPDMIDYGGDAYYYMYNLQGDVIGLVDTNNTWVVEYRYDPWGTLLLCSGTLATTLGFDNPFRYRAYEYDEETGLYYLLSRYYRPTWCRFISADTNLGGVGGLLSHNAYAYAINNPVNMSDPSGFDAVPWAEVQSLTQAEFIGILGADSSKVSLVNGHYTYKGTGTIIDLESGRSFRVSFTKRLASTYHFGLFLIDQADTVEMFQEILGIKPEEAGEYRKWADALAWDARSAVFILDGAPGVQIACSINMMPHSDDVRPDLAEGNICMYLKDSNEGDPAYLDQHRGAARASYQRTKRKGYSENRMQTDMMY